MSASVSCLVSSTTKAEQIVSELQTEGIDRERISVLFPDPRQPMQLAYENTGPMAPGPLVGTGTGIAIGGVVGWLVGLAVIAIPGVGPFIAAGPIVAALGSASIGAAVGALTGGLIGMGMPEAQAEYYEAKIREGQFMIWAEVLTPEDIKRSTAVFTRNGAEDIALSIAAADMMEHEAVSAPEHIQETG